MPRGKFWEVTYDPDWKGPLPTAHLTKLDGSSGLIAQEIVAEGGKPAQVRWRKQDEERHFQRCDFTLHVKDSHVSSCRFTGCRFAGSVWENVKFSNCEFESCDFSNVVFRGCQFVAGCRFCRNSASAELFRIENTAISATAFLSSLETNLKHVAEQDLEYQRYRFVGTKEKIAKAVYDATRNEADLNFYFEAYEQLTRCALKSRIEMHRFAGGSKERRRWPASFLVLSLPARFEQAIIESSGWLTDWGRSILRSCAFFTVVTVLFAALYAVIEHGLTLAMWKKNVVDSLIEAANVTLVVGYGSHFKPDASLLLRFLWLFNVILGLFWYSLIIPVVSRRVLR
jgi:hypothetical protein